MNRTDRSALEREVAALDQARAHADLDGWSTTEVRGPDAAVWLNDLVTAEVERLEAPGLRRSLLLSPTGRIRADFLVLRPSPEPAFFLLQPPGQPSTLLDLLAPYVLSSDVEVVPADVSGWFVAPEATGGWRLLEDRGELAARADALDAWRIRHGLARFPVDVDVDSLPAEAGLDREPLIDRTKGCYLGQESVARVRNLGHPPRVVLAARAAPVPERGTAVMADGNAVGTVTSADPDDGAALIRIRWDARRSALATVDGTVLEVRGP